MSPKPDFRAHSIVTKHNDPSSELQTATFDGTNDSPNFDFLRQTTLRAHSLQLRDDSPKAGVLLYVALQDVWSKEINATIKKTAAIMVHSSQLPLLYCCNLENNCSLERL